MSDTLPSDKSVQNPILIIEKDDNIQAGQLRASISAAAISLVQAGVHDGKLSVTPAQAINAAAAIFQIVHSSVHMRVTMAQVARENGVRDVYNHIVERRGK